MNILKAILAFTLLTSTTFAETSITFEPDPTAGSKSVLVPLNPQGVNVCRDFIEYHIGARQKVTLSGRTAANMGFRLDGKLVGEMKATGEFTQTATCKVL